MILGLLYFFLLGVIVFFVAGVLASAVVAAVIGGVALGGGPLRRRGYTPPEPVDDADAQRVRIVMTIAVTLFVAIGITGVILVSSS